MFRSALVFILIFHLPPHLPECLVMKREGVEVCQEEIALAVMHPNLLRAAATVRLLSFKKKRNKSEVDCAGDGVLVL